MLSSYCCLSMLIHLPLAFIYLVMFVSSTVQISPSLFLYSLCSWQILVFIVLTFNMLISILVALLSVLLITFTFVVELFFKCITRRITWRWRCCHQSRANIELLPTLSCCHQSYMFLVLRGWVICWKGCVLRIFPDS